MVDTRKSVNAAPNKKELQNIRVMLNFIQKNLIKINLNKNDSNKDGDGSYVYRQRKRTGIVKGIL